MIKAARKYGVRCSATLPSRDLKLAMPAWHHIGATTRALRARQNTIDCLATRHGARSVADYSRVADRLERWDDAHTDRDTCACAGCSTDRDVLGCPAPNVCARTASRAVQNLIPSWNPRVDGNVDGLTLTRTRKVANSEARADQGRIVFDPSVTQVMPLANVFRVFSAERRSLVPTTRPPRPFAVQEEAVEVYTDGSCTYDAMGNACAGSGAWFGPDDARNCAGRVPEDVQSNQTAEIHAVVLALSKVPPSRQST
ncbi:hypothetical protein C2E23DRAFT_735683 [Lenzites betulinus]|nr:hypothetical protein C2E23DRAFT_735683 [Lenzites betulinus]